MKLFLQEIPNMEKTDHIRRVHPEQVRLLTLVLSIDDKSLEKVSGHFSSTKEEADEQLISSPEMEALIEKYAELIQNSGWLEGK